MGLFDCFKKKKEATYEVNDIRVSDLDTGFVFDYNLTTWVVEATYTYDWGDEYFSREYRVNNGKEKLFLSVEEDDGELCLSFMKKIKLRKIKTDLAKQLLEDQKPPQELEYEAINYYLENCSNGYFNDPGRGDTWEEFRCWDFEDESGKHLLTIEQWDDDDFEASIGLSINSFEISNILPSKQQ